MFSSVSVFAGNLEQFSICQPAFAGDALNILHNFVSGDWLFEDAQRTPSLAR